MIQIHVGSRGLAHLPHGRRESPRSTIGHGAVEALVAGPQHRVEDALLGDGVPDLNRGARNRFGVLGELDGGKGGTMDAVASGATAEGDDQISGVHLLGRAPVGKNPDRPGIHERIPHVAFVEPDSAVDRGDAHPVAVVPYTGNDAPQDAPWMHRAAGHALRRQIGGAHEKAIGVGDGKRASPAPSTSRMTPPIPVPAPP